MHRQVEPIQPFTCVRVRVYKFDPPLPRFTASDLYRHRFAILSRLHCSQSGVGVSERLDCLLWHLRIGVTGGLSRGCCHHETGQEAVLHELTVKASTKDGRLYAANDRDERSRDHNRVGTFAVHLNRPGVIDCEPLLDITSTAAVLIKPLSPIRLTHPCRTIGREGFVLVRYKVPLS